MNHRYALTAGFTISVIVMSWIFFTSISASAIAAPSGTSDTGNQLYRQIPKDNDANYRLPTYIPTHSKSLPRKKIEFKEGADNDALYYTPVKMPKNLPQKAPAAQKPTPQKAKTQAAPARTTAVPQYQQQQYQQPTAPLQPQPRQPEAPVYVPQYQQQQYQQPAPQEEAPAAEYYPYYYY